MSHAKNFEFRYFLFGLFALVFMPVNLQALPETMVFTGKISNASQDDLGLLSRDGIHLSDSVTYAFQVDLQRNGYVHINGHNIIHSGSAVFFDSLMTQPLFFMEASDSSTIVYEGSYLEISRVPYFTLMETMINQDTVRHLTFVCIGDTDGSRILPRSCANSSGVEMLTVGNDTSRIFLTGEFHSYSTAIKAPQRLARPKNTLPWFREAGGLHLFDAPGKTQSIRLIDGLGRAYPYPATGMIPKANLPKGPFYIDEDSFPSEK